eukprot:jgi/Mesen1/1331/ME000013S00823
MASLNSSDWSEHGVSKENWVGRVVGHLSAYSVEKNNTSTSGRAALSPVDAAITDAVFFVLEKIGLDMKHPSPITKDLPLVSNPSPVILSVVAYLVVVWVWTWHIKSAGLKPRQQDPLPLQWLVILHNLFLCGLSLFMGLGMVSEAFRNGYSFWGNRPSDKEYTMGYLIYIFYASKLYEFMDTLAGLVWSMLHASLPLCCEKRGCSGCEGSWGL